jgi:hypothetical protein
MTHEQDFLIHTLWRVVKRREYYRRWCEKNAERKRENYRRWCANNKEKRRERARQEQRRWRANNPDKHRINKLRRRAHKLSASGSFSVKQFKALCVHFKNHCLKCGRPRKMTPDHVIPLSWVDRPEYQGVALNDIDNIQPLCRSCNVDKNAQHVDYRTIPHRNCINPPMVEDYLS